jgi:AcrR family transcriptional regulator
VASSRASGLGARPGGGTGGRGRDASRGGGEREHAAAHGVPWTVFDDLDLDPMLGAALEEFTSRGYVGGSVRAIAARAGVTVPTLYYHYGNKQGLLVALLEASVRDLKARLDAAVRSVPDDPVQQCGVLVACTVLFTCYRPSIAWLDAEARYLDAVDHVRYVAPRAEIERRFLAATERGRTQGSLVIGDPELRLRALFGAMRAIAVWFRPDGPLDPEAVAIEFVALALDLLGASEEANRRTVAVLSVLLGGADR